MFLYLQYRKIVISAPNMRVPITVINIISQVGLRKGNCYQFVIFDPLRSHELT